MSKVPLAGDFLRSSVVTDPEHGALHELDAVRAWLAEQRRNATMHVRRIPFSEMGAWRFSAEVPLRLEHATGRFFTVEGARFSVNATGRTWDQPILNQPEVGLLGLLATVKNGVVHFLAQAKWEPGNAEMQLSPTVQATRSNYTLAHGGRGQPYIEHFANPPDGSVLFDSLMPEHGRFFLRKFNRNIVVRVGADVAPRENFIWLTLGQIKALLRTDDLVHMDTRSVIACLPLVGDAAFGSTPSDDFGAAVARSAMDDSGVTGERAWLESKDIALESKGLDALSGWTIGADVIRPASPAHDAFSIVAVHVEAGAREVSEWTQPMIEPAHSGFQGLLCSKVDGVMSFLVEARNEAGYAGAAQLFPTVTSSDVVAAPLAAHFLPEATGTARFSAQHAEEGGRFLAYENRLSIVELSDASAADVPSTHRWLTLGQIYRQAAQGRVGMELRNLLACVPVPP